MKTKDFFRCTARPLKIFITLSILIFIVLFFGLIFFLTVRVYYWQSLDKQMQGQQWDIHRSQKSFLPDGTIILVGQEDNQRNGRSKKTEKLYDANYTPLWEGPIQKRPDAYSYLEWAKGKEGVMERHLDDMQKVAPAMSRALEIPVRKNDKIKEVWRYLPEEDFFIGYEFKGDKIGYIGANGFTLSQTGAQPFGQLNAFYGIIPSGYETPVLIWQTDRRVFTIDFENRKTEILIDGGDKKISYVTFNNWSFSDSNSISQESGIKYRSLIQCKTDDDKYHLILLKPDQHIILNIPEEWEKYIGNSVATAATEDGIFLYHSTSNILTPQGYAFRKIRDEFFKTAQFKKPVQYSAELYRVDNEGDISLVSKFDWIKPEFRDNIDRDMEEQLITYATIVSPAVFHPLNTAIAHFPDNVLNKYGNGMTGGYLIMIQMWHPRNLTINIALSVLMMSIVLWHGWARRTSRFRFVFWLVLVGLFNLAGLLTYLALNHTAVIKCPVCGKSRGLEKSECNRCGSTIPPPQGPILSDLKTVH
jgi:hypothetical protein